MAEAQDGACFDLHVVRRGHGDLGMTKHSLGGDQPEAGVYLRAEFLAEGVERRARYDAVCAERIGKLNDVTDAGDDLRAEERACPANERIG